MESILLSEEKLNALAEQASKRISDTHYYQNGAVRGDQLKDFCGHDQINRFLLFQVYQVWGMLSAKLKHPYFDFENEEVKQSMGQLQNVLSRHISIKQEEFQPLLKKSVYNTLKLSLSPKEALSTFFFANQDKISVDTYQQYLPYFSDFNFALYSILQYYRKNEIMHIEKDVFFLKFDKAAKLYEEKSGGSIQRYREDIVGKITGKNMKDIAEEAAQEQRLRQIEEQLLLQQAEEERRSLEAGERQKQEEAARLLAEQHRLQLEEEQRKQSSFFDQFTTNTSDTYFEIEEDAEAVGKSLEPILTEEKPIVTSPMKEEASEKTIPLIVTNEEIIEKPNIPLEETPAIAVETEQHKPTLLEKLFGKKEESSEGKENIVTDIQEKSSSIFDQLRNKAENVVENVKENVGIENVTEKSSSIFDQLRNKAEDVVENVKENVGIENVTEKSSSIFDQLRNKAENVVEDVKESIGVQKTVEDTPVNKENEEEKPKTLADVLKEKQIHSTISYGGKLKIDQIPLHKQFQYVQKVFGGNNVRFRLILDKVNNASNGGEVEEIIQKFIFTEGNTVNPHDSVVEEFLAVLRGK